MSDYHILGRGGVVSFDAESQELRSHDPEPKPSLTSRWFARKPPRPKLVFAFDATASREDAWEVSMPLTDACLNVLPGQLDIALAVHGGSKLHTFTGFESNIRKLRKVAAKVKLVTGETRLLPILSRVLEMDDVGNVVYVGDSFEESEREARRITLALKQKGIRLIILHDHDSYHFSGADIFEEMARGTGGAVFPFDVSAIDRLRDLLSAIGVLAVGGMTMLEEQQDNLPGVNILISGLRGD